MSGHEMNQVRKKRENFASDAVTVILLIEI